MKAERIFLSLMIMITLCSSTQAQEFQLNSSGYFQNKGVNVMVYDDIYPEGHQGGMSLIMHGHRVATNGDIR